MTNEQRLATMLATEIPTQHGLWVYYPGNGERFSVISPRNGVLTSDYPEEFDEFIDSIPKKRSVEDCFVEARRLITEFKAKEEVDHD